MWWVLWLYNAESWLLSVPAVPPSPLQSLHFVDVPEQSRLMLCLFCLAASLRWRDLKNKTFWRCAACLTSVQSLVLLFLHRFTVEKMSRSACLYMQALTNMRAFHGLRCWLCLVDQYSVTCDWRLFYVPLHFWERYCTFFFADFTYKIYTTSLSLSKKSKMR